MHCFLRASRDPEGAHPRAMKAGRTVRFGSCLTLGDRLQPVSWVRPAGSPLRIRRSGGGCGTFFHRCLSRSATLRTRPTAVLPMSTIIQSIEKAQLRDVPVFKAGDTVRVHFKVIEGTRQRIQVFEGVVLKRQGSGARETFTVRKQSFGVGVERTFPLHSPSVAEIILNVIAENPEEEHVAEDMREAAVHKH